METTNENQEVVNQDPPEETVGDIMKKSKSDGIKFWVIVISALVYCAGVLYAEVHGITMLSKGVPEDLKVWAYMGMVAAGISALLFPVALKTWTIEAKQRLAAYAFYLLDFGFLVFNAFTDFNTQQGYQLAPWAVVYTTYVLPASPILVAAIWAFLWELDPSVKKKVMLLSLRAAMEQKMMDKVADAAKSANVSQVVNNAASREVDRALWELFGAKPAEGYYVVDPNARRGILASFFGGLFSLVRQGISTLSQSTLPNSKDKDESQ